MENQQIIIYNTDDDKTSVKLFGNRRKRMAQPTADGETF
jgi:hypothetical protein